VINILPSTRAEHLGQVFCSHPSIRKLTFTGSTAVGKKLIAQCANGVKRITLELGGNAPFIVFDDADLDAAVAGAIASKFRNAGQTCICANRFYIQRSVYAAFVEKFTVAVSKLSQGNGMHEDVTLGPLISAKAVSKVSQLVKEAVKHGAKIVYETPYVQPAVNQQGHFYPAQILVDVNAGDALIEEEIFGPVAALVAFDDEEQVIRWVNASPYGLAAYCYTADNARIWRISEKIQTGMLGINTGLISNESAPFGGIKQSGWGREGSRYGLDDYLDIKYVCHQF
jgi:succinate-semialdehyde dehydrogenase/glutarate-semialdehyde dehydrogenase